jgi:tetratricopeptide (TPR) repeat protein
VRVINRLSVLVILALTFIFMEPTLVTGQGWYGYGNNWPYYYQPSQADIEQSFWDSEAYYFLNYYDPYGGLAYSQPRYGTPAYSIPAYSAAPTYLAAPAPRYTAEYSAPSSSNAPAYNQNTDNDSATYWLNEANVSYLTGSYEQAAGAYAKAVNLDPSLSEGWLNLGNSLYFLGKYQASLNAYGTLLKLEPQNADALTGKSLALLALNRTGDSNTSTVI